MPDDLSYYNVMLHEWVAEPGRYDLYVGSSSQDIRLQKSLVYENDDCYTMVKMQEDMIG